MAALFDRPLEGVDDAAVTEDMATDGGGRIRGAFHADWTFVRSEGCAAGLIAGVLGQNGILSLLGEQR